MGDTKELWERHNAENGEHIWCGDKHIADIVTDVDNPAWDRNTSEISKSAILMHNDPKYRAVDDLYEALQAIQNLPYIKLDLRDTEGKKLLHKVRKALAKARGK